MKIYLIRHGQTTGDLEDRYGGSYDDHLTEEGRKQIESTANRVANKGIEIIFASPLIRTKETAEIINKKLNCGITILDGLQERDYGVLGGLTKAEAKEKYPEAVELHKDPQNTDPGGESFDAFTKRVLSAFEKITSQDYNTIAVVAHNGSIKAILRNLGKNAPKQIEDGGVFEITVNKD